MFTFPLPDVESISTVDVVGPDGEITTALAPDQLALLEARLQEQNDLLLGFARQVAGAIIQQLQAQQVALGGAVIAIQQMIQQQLRGQEAALTLAWQSISEYVGQQIALQSERLGTSMAAAALLPRGPAPMPPANPFPPPPVAPGTPPPPFPRPPVTTPGTLVSTPVGLAQSGQPSTPAPITTGLPNVTPVGDRVPLPGVGPAVGVGAKPPSGPAVPIGGGGTVPIGTTIGLVGGAPQGGAVGGAGESDEGQVHGEALSILEEPHIEIINQIEQLPPPEVTVNVNVAAEEQERLPPPAVEGETRPAVEAASCPWQITDRIPPIGGPEWCRLQDAIARALAALGNAIIDTVLSPYEKAATGLESLLRAPGGAAAAFALGAPADLARKIVQGAADVLKVVRDLIQCWRDLARLAPQCQPGTLLGCIVLRGVVRALRKARVGTDAGVWATIDLSLDFRQLDRAATYIIESLCPSIIPDAASAWSTYTSGYVDEQTMRCWSLAHGVDPDLWRPVRQARGNTLDAHAVVMYSRLYGVDPSDADVSLRQRGWSRDADRAAFLTLYDAVPTPQQWLRWQHVGALDDDVSRLLRRDEGFVQWWVSAAGSDARAQGMTELVALHEWRGQQPLPSLSELATGLYRLRPGVAPPGLEVTEQTVRAVLDAGDMTPLAVDWAMATIYRPVSVGDVLAEVRQGRQAEGAITAAYLDAGYAQPDAERISKGAYADALRSYHASVGGWSLSTCVGLLRAGATLPSEAVSALDAQGYDDNEVQRAVLISALQESAMFARRGRMRAKQRAAQAAILAYTVGTISAPAALAGLVASGYTTDAAGALLTSTDLSLQAQRTQHAISQVRRGLLRGELSIAQAATILSTAGVQPQRISQLSAAWAIEQAADRPMAPVGQVRKWVAEGLMPVATARTRLRNMGWRDPDLTLMVSEMGQALARAQATAQRKGATAAQAAAKAADRVRQQALRRLERQRPVAALGQWYRDGLLDEATVRQRMTQYGYNEATTTLYLRGWDRQRDRKRSTKTSVSGTRTLSPQRQVPIRTVRAWFLDGIVDEAWVNERLASYGYDTDAIDGYVQQWNQQAAARAARKKAPAPV